MDWQEIWYRFSWLPEDVWRPSYFSFSFHNRVNFPFAHILGNLVRIKSPGKRQ